MAIAQYSSQKKYPPPKGEEILVLQRGFPLPGINFDSPGAPGKNLPAKRRGDFWCSSGDFPYRG